MRYAQVRIIPFAAIQFTSHEQYVHYFSTRGEITPIGRFAAGAMAGATGVCGASMGCVG